LYSYVDEHENQKDKGSVFLDFNFKL